MKLRKLICLVGALLLLSVAATAEESAFTPIPWTERVMPYAPKDACYLPDNGGYHDDSLDIRIETLRRDDTDIMLAYVTLTDPSQFRTGTASPAAGSKRTAPVSAMAKSAQAVMAISGDYFAYHTDGIVVRNEKQLRLRPTPGRDTLIVDENGDFTILSPTSQEAFDAFQGTVVHAFCFGPGLVKDGEALTDLTDVMIDNGKERKTQRIAIGQTGPLSYVVVCTEGPENANSVGFDLLQMAALCKELGCINAYNLDGGSSATIVLDNKKINALSSGKVRSVSDMIFFATLVP